MADRMIQCTSTNNKDHFRKLSGLPIHPYFSALKLKWIIENVETVADAIRKGYFVYLKCEFIVQVVAYLALLTVG